MKAFRLTRILTFSAAAVVAPAMQAQRTPATTRDATPTREAAPERAELTLLPSGLSDQLVKAHVMSPSQLSNVVTDADDTRASARRTVTAIPKAFTSTPHVDMNAFGQALHSAFKDNVAGYMLQIRQNGTLIHTGIWEWAQTPSDQGKGWTPDTRMHVASVSKFLTAVGMVKVLGQNRISYDTPIINYLPVYWAKGSNIDKITFRHLLTHKSGFSTDGSMSDYNFMKARVANGVMGVGAYDYENMNFGLMRILIPIINGDVGKSAKYNAEPATNDQIWDAVTIYAFRNYMQANVFTPAGVGNVQFKPVPGMASALAYKHPAGSTGGWNSGDLSAAAGGAAWRLSIKELLNVMDHVRRRNTILPATTAQYMLDNGLGIDQAVDTPAGKIYNKNGRWATECVGDTQDCKTEQSVAYFLPNGMELAIFVNSPIGPEELSLRDLVRDAYINSLSQ